MADGSASAQMHAEASAKRHCSDTARRDGAGVAGAAASAAAAASQPRSYSAAVRRVEAKAVAAEVLGARKAGCAAIAAAMRVTTRSDAPQSTPTLLIPVDAQAARKLPPAKAFAEVFVRLLGYFAVALMSPSGQGLEVYFSTDEARQAALELGVIDVSGAKFRWRVAERKNAAQSGTLTKRVLFHRILPSVSVEALKSHVARIGTLVGDVHEHKTLEVSTGVFSCQVRLNDGVDIDKIPQRVRTERGWITMTIDGQLQQCFACGATSHKITDCSKRNACFKCGVVGHAARDCSARATSIVDDLSALPRLPRAARVSPPPETTSTAQPLRGAAASATSTESVDASLLLSPAPVQETMELSPAATMDAEPTTLVASNTVEVLTSECTQTPGTSTRHVDTKPTQAVKRTFEDTHNSSGTSVDDVDDDDDDGDEDDDDDDDEMSDDEYSDAPAPDDTTPSVMSAANVSPPVATMAAAPPIVSTASTVTVMSPGAARARFAHAPDQGTLGNVSVELPVQRASGRASAPTNTNAIPAIPAPPMQTSAQ